MLLGLSFGQKIENVVSSQSGQSIRIKYDLTAESTSSIYNISVYYSLDGGTNFSGPVRSISGDYDRVGSGRGKTINWDVTKDLPALKGDNIVFKLEGANVDNLGFTQVKGFLFEVKKIELGFNTVKCSVLITNRTSQQLNEVVLRACQLTLSNGESRSLTECLIGGVKTKAHPGKGYSISPYNKLVLPAQGGTQILFDIKDIEVDGSTIQSVYIEFDNPAIMATISNIKS